MAVRAKIKDFCTSLGYNAVSKVRVNSNGYKYVTLANTTSGDTENIYLGIRFGETVEVSDRLDLDNTFVTQVENKNGELRYKVTDRSGEISAEKLADYDVF